MATNNKDQYNFRVGSAEKKKDFKDRTNKLKEEKNVSAREIYEAGLRVFENGNSEAQILNRRNKTISERDMFFNLFIDSNLKIKAYNRQLRNKNERYRDYTDKKDVLTVYDKDGNELKELPSKDGKIKFKKLEFF